MPQAIGSISIASGSDIRQRQCRAEAIDDGRYQGTVTSSNAFARQTLAAILPIPAERFRISADGYR